MILLGLLLPLAMYLLILGMVNRRQHPFFVSGVWDFITLLLAVSGFLFSGGPLIISRLTDSLYLGWLARSDGGETISRAQLWLILSVFYFLLVVLLVTAQILRTRRLTSIYNVDPEQLEVALDEAFNRLGLKPLRSGRLFFFRKADTPAEGPDAQPAAVLEVEPFLSFRHATLIWDPPTAAMREQVEIELSRTLADEPTEPNEVGFWFVLAGLFLLGLSLIAAAAQILYLFR